MSLQNGFDNGVASFGEARMMSGTFGVQKAKSHILLIGPGGVEYLRIGAWTGAERLVFWPEEGIEELETISSESRITATRLATLGLAGAGLKKERTWVRICDIEGQQSVFEVNVAIGQVDAWLSAMPWMNDFVDERRERPSTTDTEATSVDLAGQLERIARLHADGLLTDEEFTAAKSQLLAGGEEISARPDRTEPNGRSS